MLEAVNDIGENKKKNIQLLSLFPSSLMFFYWDYCQGNIGQVAHFTFNTSC